MKTLTKKQEIEIIGGKIMKCISKKLTLCVSIILLISAFTACGSSNKKDKFTIAYAPNESTEQSTDARNGLADALSKEIGMEVEEIQATDYNAIVEALRTGQADMAYMGPLAIALGNERAEVEPIVMKATDGDKTNAVYHSVFITRADNDEINSIEDIKGKTMAFVDPDSTSGNLVPTAEIIGAFPNENLTSDSLHTNGEFFEAVSYSGQHQAGLQALLKGDVDVVPISDQILQSEIDCGNAKEEDIKIIYTSGDIPAEGIVVNKDMDDNMREKVTEFLVEFDDKAYFEQVIKNADARFVECSIDDYKDIIELNSVLNSEE